MASKKKEEIDDRKARLYGGLGGLAASEARLLPGLIGDPLGLLADIGTTPYSEHAFGVPVRWLIDRKEGRKLDAIRDYLQAPKIPTVAAAESYFQPAAKDFPQPIRALRSLLERDSPISHIGLRSPELADAAHEIAHSTPSPIRSLSLVAGSPLVKALSTALGVGLGLSDDETVSSWAPLAPGLSVASDLLEEARATAKGINAIRAVESNRAALSALGRLAPSFGTHLVHGLPLVLAPYVAKAIKGYMIDKEQEKTSAQMPAEPKATGKKKLTARMAWAPPAPKPKTSKIGDPGMETAKPPSKTKYYRDIQKMMGGLGSRSL